MTTPTRKAEIREALVKFIKAQRSESRRGWFRLLRSLGVEYLRCVRNGQHVQLYCMDGLGDALYHRFVGGASDIACESDWTHFTDITIAMMANGEVVYPTAQAQTAANPVPVVDFVDDKTKEALANKTTDALIADTQKVLDETKYLDGKLAYQHALKAHLRGIIQGRIDPIMGTASVPVTGVDEF